MPWIMFELSLMPLLKADVEMSLELKVERVDGGLRLSPKLRCEPSEGGKMLGLRAELGWRVVSVLGRRQMV